MRRRLEPTAGVLSNASRTAPELTVRGALSDVATAFRLLAERLARLGIVVIAPTAGTRPPAPAAIAYPQ